VTVILNVLCSQWALVNITEWKIDPNVWCLDCVHFPVIFCFHEQVDGTVNFPSFNCFSSLEALQGVHRAREEHVDLSYRNPSDARSVHGRSKSEPDKAQEE
jgi:hypothetical protein